MLKLILFFWLVVGSIVGILLLPLLLYTVMLKDSLEYKNKHAIIVRMFVLFFPIASVIAFIIILLDTLFAKFKNTNLYVRIAAWLDKPYNG